MAHSQRPAPDPPASIAASEHALGAIRTERDERARVQIIVFEGEFDLSNASELDLVVDESIAAGARDFIADLSAVGFLDATLLHALLRGWKRAARRNGRFVLVAPPKHIWRVFVLTGLERTFRRFASRRQALNYLAGVQQERRFRGESRPLAESRRRSG